MKTRKAMLAGSWYPRTAQDCELEIASFLRSAPEAPGGKKTPVGGIVPHAGWHFSGEIACRVFHQLSRRQADTYVIFGMHLSAGDPCFIMAEGAWETPFGPMEIDAAFCGKLLEKFQFRIETAERYTPDNTIEVQLPFIRRLAPSARLVPVGAAPGPAAVEIGAAVGEIARELGRRTVAVGSTDLTHYGANYGFSPRGRGDEAVQWVREENDRRIIERLQAMDAQGVMREALDRRNACCSGAGAAAIAAAKSLGADRGEALAYATSCDKNPADSFVGYVGILYSGQDAYAASP